MQDWKSMEELGFDPPQWADRLLCTVTSPKPCSVLFFLLHGACFAAHVSTLGGPGFSPRNSCWWRVSSMRDPKNGWVWWENPIVRNGWNGWWLGIPLWLRKPPYAKWHRPGQDRRRMADRLRFWWILWVFGWFIPGDLQKKRRVSKICHRQPVTGCFASRICIVIYSNTCKKRIMVWIVLYSRVLHFFVWCIINMTIYIYIHVYHTLLYYDYDCYFL